MRTAITLLKNKCLLIVLPWVAVLQGPLAAQPTASAAGPDSLAKSQVWTLYGGTTATAASGKILPLWLAANRFGTISDEKADLSTYAGGTYTYRIGHFSADAGANVYLNQSFGHVFAREAYLKLNYKKWQLRGGRVAEVTGEVDPELSSGALGISGNSLPIPRISIVNPEYVNVPFTKGWVRFKGRYGHGWLGNDRFIRRSFLHEKALYLRIGQEKWWLTAGANHFGEWGGVHPKGRMPEAFDDYLNIVLGRTGDNGVPINWDPLDKANYAGNHIVTFDFSGAVRIKTSTLRLYTQTIFERGSAKDAVTRDDNKAFKIFRPDRLAGIDWQQPTGWLRGVVVEYIHTKDQGGPEFYIGRDNYYNHVIYRTGWQYEGLIIGTPLFINSGRSRNYNLNQAALGDFPVVSNRIVGGHVGLKGYLTSRVGWRTLATYVRHYGNYYNTPAFTPTKTQGHLLQEFTCRLNQGFTLNGAFGYDFGDLSRNVGGMLGVQWRMGK